MSTRSERTANGVRRAGLVGGVLGLAAAGVAAAVATEKYAIGRLRRKAPDEVEEAYGRLPADREYTVTADDGVVLHVEEVGPADAPLTVVFVHGWTLHLGSWHFQRQGLAEMTNPALRMVFFDQRSHGRSGRGDSASCTIDQLGRDLAAVLRVAVGSRPVAMVGHSMGGMSIMALADQQPQMFERQIVGIALLSTSAGALLATLRVGLPKPIRSRGLRLAIRGLGAGPKLAERLRRGASDAVWLFVRRFAFGSKDVSPALVDYVDQMIGSTPVDVIADFYPTLAGHDKVAALPGLRRTEVLLICGDNDRLTPLEHSETMAAELPDAELVVIEGAGHVAMMERAALVNLHLRAFLHRAARRASGSKSGRRRA